MLVDNIAEYRHLMTSIEDNVALIATKLENDSPTSSINNNLHKIVRGISHEKFVEHPYKIFLYRKMISQGMKCYLKW